jgi:hypothetical protein
VQRFTNGSIFYLNPNDAFNISITNNSSTANNITSDSTLSIALLTTGEPGKTGPTGSTGASIWSSNSDQSIYYSRGNVGIKQSNPQYSLDVSGTAGVTGNLYVTGNTIVTGNLYVNGVHITGGISSQWTTVYSTGNIFFQGNVGINKDDPQANLDISGNVLIAGNLWVNGVRITGGASSQWTTVSSTGNVFFRGNVGINNGDPQSTLDVAGNAIMTNLFVSGTSSNSGTVSTGALRVAGGVAIGGNNFIQGNLFIAGNITCTGNASFGNVFTNALYISSDYRLKGNIHPISITKTVDLLKPVEYDHRVGHQMGFIAHEIQKEYPFLVNGEKDGPEYQTVNYNGLIALLVKEIQELKLRMKEAEETIQQLLQR